MTKLFPTPAICILFCSGFKEPRPARTTVAVAKLVGPGTIEITVTARK
jgi:hypothetical protein